MKALVVYDSQFGNTEKIAQAIGAALAAKGEVEVVRVGQVQAGQRTGVGLLVVGSPTQGFRPTKALAEWLKGMAPGSLQGVRVAAFDTRMSAEEIKQAVFFLPWLVAIFGFAAQPIAKLLAQKGGQLAAAPEGFLVHGREGPLFEGELARAAAWAEKLG